MFGFVEDDYRCGAITQGSRENDSTRNRILYAHITGISVDTTTVPMTKGQDLDPRTRVVNDESHNGITDPWLRQIVTSQG